MATYYVDPEGGNDANNGTSFALRKRTWGGLTLADGDEVRFIASPVASAIGAGTWTAGAGFAPSTPLSIAVIDNAEVAWTGVTNITSARYTTYYTEGTSSQRFTPATAFTTGKVGYRTLPSVLDLSAYDQVSFMLAAGSLTPSQVYLALCSDTTGDVIVDRINVSDAFMDGATTAVTLPSATSPAWAQVVAGRQGGGNLGSAIASVALYVTADPGTTALQLDNIIATTAASGINHRMLVGKNTSDEPEFYPVVAINPSDIRFGNINTTQAAWRGFGGTAGSATAYKVNPMGVPLTATDRSPTSSSGTNYGDVGVTWSGGWDRTAMSTRSGRTYLNSGHGAITTAFGKTNANSSWGAVRGFTLSGFSNPWNGGTPLLIEDSALTGMTGTSILGFNSNSEGFRGKFSHTLDYVAVGLGVDPQPASVGDRPMQTRIGRYISNQGSISYVSNSPVNRPASVLYMDTARNNSSVVHGGNVTVVCDSFVNNDVDLSQSANGTTAYFATAATAVSTTGLTTSPGSVVSGPTWFRSAGFAVDWQTSVERTSGQGAWQAVVTSNISITNRRPGTFTLGRFYLTAGTHHLKGSIRRETTNLTGEVTILGLSIPGNPGADVSAVTSAAASTWQDFDLTFTTTADGVVEVATYWFNNTGTGTNTGYVADLEVT